MCTSMHVFVYACMSMCICVCMCPCVYVKVWACFVCMKYVYECAGLCVCVCVRVCMKMDWFQVVCFTILKYKRFGFYICKVPTHG